jgi:hypothetical protein
MHILTTSTSAQTLKVFLRVQDVTDYVITDNETNSTFTDTITTLNTSNWYDLITASFALVENRTYTLKLINNDNVVRYKGLIFCTNQSNYSINNDRYTVNSTTNAFIIL